MAKDITLSIDGDTTKYPSWATEDTLQQIARQLGAKRSGIGSLDVSAKEGAKATKELGKFAKKSAEALEEMAGFAGTLAGTIATTKGNFTDLVPVVDAFAKTLGKTVAALLSGVPFLSGLGDAAGVTAERLKDIFAFIAGVSDNLIDGFRGVTGVGVTFEGNLKTLVEASSKARMAIEDLPEALSQATSVLAAFSSANAGATSVLNGLGEVHKNHQKQLTRLGLTFDEINEYGIGFFDILAKSGNTALLQTGNEERLAQVTADYTKNLVVLSRITGQDRKELERQIRERMMQGNIQAQMALLSQDASTDQVLAFQKLQSIMDAFGPSVGNSLGAITTLGVASAESEAVLAQLGGSRDLIEQFAQAFKSGNLDENTANNLIQEIMNELASGVLDKNVLQTALLAPAGGFGQTIANTVSASMPIAQGIKAGKSLDELTKSVDADTKAQGTMAEQLIDRQSAYAELPFAIQDAAVSVKGFETILGTASGAAEKFAKVLINLINSDFSDFKKENDGGVEKPNPNPTDNFDMVDQFKKIANQTMIAGGATEDEMLPLRKALDKLTADVWNLDEDDLRKRINEIIDEFNLDIQKYNKGTAGVQNFGDGTLAMLHGNEAVIPAPLGEIPVNLGDSLAPLAEMITKLTNNLSNGNNVDVEKLKMETLTGGNNLLAQDGVNSVQSKEVVSKLNEMIGVLRTIADGQYTGNSQFGKEMRRLSNIMYEDLFR